MLAKQLHPQQTDNVLATLNARYIHSAFGLRYLKANLGEFESRCEIQEFTLESRPEDVPGFLRKCVRPRLHHPLSFETAD